MFTAASGFRLIWARWDQPCWPHSTVAHKNRDWF